MLALPCVVLSSLTRERLEKGLSIWPMSDEDLRKPEVLKAMEEFTVELNKKLKMHDAGLKTKKTAAQLNEELEDTPYSVKYEPFTMAELEDEFDPQPITLPPADKLTEKEQVDLVGWLANLLQCRGRLEGDVPIRGPCT